MKKLKFTPVSADLQLKFVRVWITIDRTGKWGEGLDTPFPPGLEVDGTLNIVLVEPEIPQNTGNISRTCAATRSRLHLIKPLGFDISEKAVRRAGLDYWSMVDLTVYENLEDFFARTGAEDVWLTTTKAPRAYTEAQFRDGCWLFFGKETAGLPRELRERYASRCIRIPMRPEARSLNLSNSVAVVAYEALRQLDFPNLSPQGEMADPRPQHI